MRLNQLTGFAINQLIGRLLWPILSDASTYGWNDWDASAAYRYIAVDSLARYREFPAWNPYACGGFPAWAYVEGATNVVSPSRGMAMRTTPDGFEASSVARSSSDRFRHRRS